MKEKEDQVDSTQADSKDDAADDYLVKPEKEEVDLDSMDPEEKQAYLAKEAKAKRALEANAKKMKEYEARI